MPFSVLQIATCTEKGTVGVKINPAVKIGIDLGTTRIVVAASDRGNFPLVNFEAPDGTSHDWFPPLIAVRGDTRLYGWEAMAVQGQPDWAILRSLKRWLRDAGPHTKLEVAGQAFLISVLLTELMNAMRVQLLEHSTLGAAPGETLEAMLGVPANANSNQRFLTEDAAQAAGFKVLGLLNEPSAAAIEFAYRNNSEKQSGAQSALIVYDLGGGTFDVSLVSLGESEHAVLVSDGMPNLGGDDFDEILAELALDAAGVSGKEREGFSYAQWTHLLEECREKKESLSPNTRKVTIDLERVRSDWSDVSIPVDMYYDRCRPLIESSRQLVEELLASQSGHSLDTLYVTGGGSELPPVARILRETFGRRVKRSAYMRSATAIGLAIRASAHADDLREQLTQNFGVWREADEGQNIVFDLIFPRGVKLPNRNEPPLQSQRTYRPAHNIGYFRYLECAQLNSCGQPAGEITNWDDVRFPFDPRLQNHPNLGACPVDRFAPPEEFLMEETYTCDSSGKLKVTIASKATGFAREYRIGRWSGNGKHIASGRSKTRARQRPS